MHASTFHAMLREKTKTAHSLIPRLHDRANVVQTLSKRPANIEQTSNKYEACIKHSDHQADIERTSSKRRANIKLARPANI